MKKIVLLALAASTVAVATPASAQTVTGTIDLTGSVAPKCLVLPGAGDTFGTTTSIQLNELAGPDGTLRTGIAADVNSNVAMTARVVCTTANPNISVATTALATLAPADTNYDNSIDFKASVAVVTTGTNNGPFFNDSANPPLASTPIGSRLANSGNNVTITTSNFRTNALTDLLVADPTYTGKIVVLISPGT